MISVNLDAGSESRLKFGMKPVKIAPQSRLPDIATTTPKKLTTTMATMIFRIISKTFTPLLPLSYDHTTAAPMTKSSSAHQYLPLSPSRMPKFC